MSVLDDKKQNNTEAPVEDILELEDLIEADDFAGFDKLTATLHFEFNDILNAIEHIESSDDEPAEPEEQQPEDAETLEVPEEPEEQETESEISDEPIEGIPANHDITSEFETPEPEVPEEPIDDISEEPASLETSETDEPADEEAFVESAEDEVTEESADEEPASAPQNPDVVSELAEEVPIVSDESAEVEPAEEVTPEPSVKTHEGLITKYKHQDQKTKKLVLTDIILFAVIAASIIVGLVAANSLVNKANAANEAKIAEMQTNIKEIDLAESLYSYAADEVIENIAVPTYTLDQLYALDLREKTGFTAADLKMITRKGLVGCEEAFVKAEETYGVNSIFLMSIASLESAYGTQMFRPNNMFGYGRTGFSSKEECIMTVAKGLGTRYLKPGGGLYGGSPTLKGVNKRYAANPQWYYKVGKYMQGYYNQLAAQKNGTLDKFE